ncbi:DUF2059 domain-containing protein [Edaphobacter modestus]|uniref:DUF2059 domain-containing protein n=1 Tax=Edaphobacter modestus TaxID=388466 RepID=A0A4Q7YX29_9BACT|nr:DUF2059 domain-containing protein [Edaphobacter modestus]RZU41974.1 hypothetical protein BDD14_3516 [Edaphobacter modestus]
MKNRFLALLLSLAIAPLAHADDASKRAKVEELIQITKLNQLMGQMTNQMTARMKTLADQQSANRSFTPAQQKLVTDYVTQIQTITQNAVSWEKIKPTVVQVYIDTYTDQELDGILAFYHSPAGQALIAKSPQLMTRTMQLVQTQMNEVQPQMRQANEDFTRKMKELGPVGPASNQPTVAPTSHP